MAKLIRLDCFHKQTNTFMQIEMKGSFARNVKKHPSLQDVNIVGVHLLKKP